MKRIPHTTPERPCTKCGLVKPIEEYPFSKRYKDGRASSCKVCKNKRELSWYHANKDKAKVWMKRYASSDKAKARNRVRNKQDNVRLRTAAIAYYSGGTNACSCCGETTYEFLAIDHVRGGGNAHKKAIKRAGTNYYRWLAKNGYPDGLRVLCHNCNCARGFYGVCPHEIKGGIAIKEDAHGA